MDRFAICRRLLFCIILLILFVLFAFVSFILCVLVYFCFDPRLVGCWLIGLFFGVFAACLVVWFRFRMVAFCCGDLCGFVGRGAAFGSVAFGVVFFFCGFFVGGFCFGVGLGVGLVFAWFFLFFLVCSFAVRIVPFVACASD
nr:hypothetical protein [Enterococcus faecium]